MDLLSRVNTVFETEAKGSSELLGLVNVTKLKTLAVGLDDTLAICTNLSGEPVKNSLLKKEVEMLRNNLPKSIWYMANVNKLLRDLTEALKLRSFRVSNTRNKDEEIKVNKYISNLAYKERKLGGLANFLLKTVFTEEAKDKLENYKGNFNFELTLYLGREVEVLHFTNVTKNVFILFLTQCIAEELTKQNSDLISDSQKKVINDTVKSVVNEAKVVDNSVEYEESLSVESLTTDDIEKLTALEIKDKYSSLYGSVYYLLDQNNLEDLKNLSKVVKKFTSKVKMATVGVPYQKPRSLNPLLSGENIPIRDESYLKEGRTRQHNPNIKSDK